MFLKLLNSKRGTSTKKMKIWANPIIKTKCWGKDEVLCPSIFYLKYNILIENCIKIIYNKPKVLFQF